jgi:folate-binding Fe-S cluster repair protein YgfZ
MYLSGPDAEEAADWLFTTDTGKEPGRVVYTCSLNSKGGVEADVTVTPLQEGVGTLDDPILKVGNLKDFEPVPSKSLSYIQVVPILDVVG